MSKPVATRDFAIQVTPGAELVDGHVRALVAGIVELGLNWTTYNVAFIPFEPPMAPPFPADPPTGPGIDGWRTEADARVELFFDNRLVVTPYDPLAGQERAYASRYGAPLSGEVEFGPPWQPRPAVVFYTSTDQYGTLTADLERFLETHSGWNREERALELEGRPVVDFIVERLQTSRLVPDDLLYWLGLSRTTAD